MANLISALKINFTGLAIFRKANPAQDLYKKAGEYAKQAKLSVNEIPADSFRAYANIKENHNVKLIKKWFSFGIENNTQPLPVYRGSTAKNAGFSTETGGYGGGWLKSDINTPLSTTDVHTCAALNLVDEKNGQHLLYHVYHGTSANCIKSFILEKFPNFNKANILPGDAFETNNTVNKILAAVNEINPKAEKKFSFFASENPEVVAHGGDLSYIENKPYKSMTFRQIKQYFLFAN